jgi:hypothetical protein
MRALIKVFVRERQVICFEAPTPLAAPPKYGRRYNNADQRRQMEEKSCKCDYLLCAPPPTKGALVVANFKPLLRILI